MESSRTRPANQYRERSGRPGAIRFPLFISSRLSGCRYVESRREFLQQAAGIDRNRFARALLD